MDPCSVCGGTDVNLVDGFYYCVECGTQDVNVRETVVEQTVMGDGTFAHTTSRRFTTVVQDSIEMSSEWHKWHTFNFILAGLTDELVALGAKPSVKMKVLWIWSRYVKHFQVKDETQLKSKLDIGDDDDDDSDNTGRGKENKGSDDEDFHSDDSAQKFRKRKSKTSKSDKIVRDIKTITKGTILAILYVALNLDRSDIQLSHLFRFIREGRLSLYDCMKYVPKELKMNVVNNWKSFALCQTEHSPLTIREFAMTCFKILKLGVPLVPDLRKLVSNCVKELCLPEDVKDLVFALMHYVPVDFLNIDAKIQKSLVRIPDYEGICMAYLLVALKICFGLDDEYELRISEEVDKINDEENFLKSYKLGMFSETCDRLFSFKEWCQHLQFRKYILCKNFLPMSRQFNSQTDEHVFMEHLETRRKREIKLSDEVTMDILDKIKSGQESQVIPKADFPVTLTPMSTYTDIIANCVQDPDLRLLLCEDFTQYSLKYAIKDLMLPDYSYNSNNPLVGVSKSEKKLNNYIIGTLTVQEGDMTMVYVRNCQNKNWLKTEPPKVHHVTKICHNETSSDKESDHGYDSNVENSNPECDLIQVTINDESVHKNDKTLEITTYLDGDKHIFDDNFNFINILTVPSDNGQITLKEEREEPFFEINAQSNSVTEDSKVFSLDNIENCAESDLQSVQFDPNVFDRDKMIKELIELACKQYKIPRPKENTINKQRKRKVNLVQDEASASEPKKKRTVKQSKPGEAQREVDNLVSSYYTNLQNDYLHKISQHLKSIIDDIGNPNILDKSKVLEVDDSIVKDTETEINNSNVLNFEKSLSEIDTNGSVLENSIAIANPDKQNGDNETEEENIHGDVLDEIFPKSDPKFDEKDHDIRQLYVKLDENLDTSTVLMSDVDNDPEIDKIIQKNIEKYSNIDKNALAKTKNNLVIDEIDNMSDSDDDLPLSTLKETNSLEQEKIERRKEKLQPLLRDPSRLKTFKYWVRHYKSIYVVKKIDIGKKFDRELNENLPKSFVYIIRECAAILGCSMFSLYKNMQNIEEILIVNKY